MSQSANAELERIIDERLAVAVDTSVGGCMSMLNVWQDTLESTEQWIKSSRSDFITFADTISTQYGERQREQESLDHSLRDHTYSTRPRPTKFAPHWCSRECWWRRDVVNWVNYSPLEIPIHLGWQRVVMLRSSEGRDVNYVAPCGRRLRSIEEVQMFLNETDVVNVDISSFTFDPVCAVVHGVYKPLQGKYHRFRGDITEGKEALPISCINAMDVAIPEPFQYTNTRTSGPGVDIAADAGFLVSCACQDNCSSGGACPCQQLTLQEAKAIGDAKHPVGYLHHRLCRPQLSGIYECNAGCRCGPQCANRVVQSGIRHRLQVYRTSDKGWGLRTLDDIPRGAFVCTYIGHIYTEQGGDEMAVHYGDEYFAELDYIEVMERHKEGYESDVEVNHHSDSSSSMLSDSAGSTYSIESMGRMKVRIRKVSRLRLREGGLSSCCSEEEEEEEQHHLTVDHTPPSPRSPSSTGTAPLRHSGHAFSPLKGVASRTRRYFHEDHSYIMDAKCQGNVGRYINHSCKPNMVVQNVFIDTHDLRFPWVAFFAKRHIRALQELTWDYNYEVGSVEGKYIKCMCGTAKCRGRLL